ncbi:MAG: hypothetical protein IPM07_17895 [Anaerolineales bacterium]|nr:hypothetical protein [Anaerolineales bacterium]
MTTGLRTTRIRWAVLLLIVAGVGLRALRLAWQPLWWDEGYSVYFATEPLARMFDLTAHDIHPPLYYLLLHGWIAWWGSPQPLVDRSLSVLFGAAALPLQAWLAGRLFPGRRRLLIVAVLLLAVNPMHLLYSQEVRMYGLGMALSTAGTAFFWIWQRRLAASAGWRGWLWPALGYTVVMTAGLYTLYYFAFLLAGHLLWAALVYRRALRRLAVIVVGQAVIVVLYLPWLLYATPRLIGYIGAKVTSDQDVALGPLRYLERHFAAFSGGHLPWPNMTLPWAFLLGGAAVTIMVAALARRRGARSPAGERHAEPPMTHDERSALLLLGVLTGVAVVGGWLVNLRFPFFPEGGERLLIFALPYGSLLLAAGIDRTWKYAYAGRVALILLLTAAAGGVFTFYTTPRYSEHDYRALLREIVQQGRNEDALLAIFPWQVGYWRAYTPQDDPLLTGPTPRLLSDGAVTWSPAVQASVDAALAAGALWFPEPLTFGSTLPAEIEAYLEENASNLENRWYGATRLTAWADLPTPEAGASQQADFGAVQLLVAATTPESVEAANQPISAQLTWQVAEPTKLNISLRLLDDAGSIWSSRDYAVDWSSLTPGAQETHRVGLIAPVGLPPGAYTVAVSVARQDDRGERGDALTLTGSDKVDAPIRRVTVVAPVEVQSAARLPIRTPLATPSEQEGVALLGFTGPDAAPPMLAGSELGLTLFLQSTADTPAARSLYVSLLDAQGAGVAGYTGWPLPNYPLSLLTQGELLRVPVRFFAPGALASGDYRLVAGFQDEESGAQSPAVTLGTVRIEQRRASFERGAPAVSLATPAQFGTHARLYGYGYEPDGDGARVRLYWEIVQPLLPPHHIFVHADTVDGVTLAQQDGPPVTAAGPAPSGSWQPGEFLITEHIIQAPTGTTIKVGLYDPVTLVRLPVTIDGVAAGDSVILREE